jgi:PiT family inorganic phosphate transporter
MSFIVFAIVLFLAWSNGSNDNFKGVATIYGSGTASYRTALAWATVTTLAGSLLTLVLAAGLVKTFSAKGLVPAEVAASPRFLAAAALGAALTVTAASRLGMPVSTTHALTGALIGAGFASGSGVNLGVLGKSFFLPLLLSPVLAMAITIGLYPMSGLIRRGLGLQDAVPASALGSGAAAPGGLDLLHFLSAGAVSFARGLNDTPKIVAILLGGQALGMQPQVGLLAVGVAMALGGLIGARRVAETMSKRIVTLNAGQGLVANLTTALLVIAASRFGLPVSTTHVATGGLFGIGVMTGAARAGTIATILLAWATTLPLGAALGAGAMLGFTRLF